MSARCGPLVVAIASVVVRLAGDSGAADVLALGYLAALTGTLYHARDLQVAARVAHSCANLQQPRVVPGTYSVAH
jgi:hypothetical protein